MTNVSTHGFWLLLEQRELFVSFAAFPWFRDASIGALTNVELPSPHHLYWPDLDVDLAVDSIVHPERYPLVSQATRAQASSGIAKRPHRVTSRARTRRG